MFCNKCGQKLPDTVKFCPRCGAPVSPRQTQAAQPPVREQAPGPDPGEDVKIWEPDARRPAPREAAAQNRSQPRPSQRPQSGRKRKSSSHKSAAGIVIGVAAALAVLLAVAALLLWRFGLPPFPGRETGDGDRPASSDRDKTDDGKAPEKETLPRDETPEEKYPNTVDTGDFIANTAAYNGVDLALRATVENVFRQNVALTVETEPNAETFASATAAVKLSDADAAGFAPGDRVYVRGIFHLSDRGVAFFESATGTRIDGPQAGAVCNTVSGVPVILTGVEDYSVFLGAHATSESADGLVSSGGQLVQLEMSGQYLNYTVTSASPGAENVAQITGSVYMDGTPEIDLAAPDDGWGNEVTGKLYLLLGGGVALETSASGSGEWGLEIPYTELGTCYGTVPTLYEPAGECTQELVLVSSGATGVMTLRNWDHGKWQDLLTVDTDLGKNGVSYNKREGDRCTPAGTFNILFAFGTASRTTALPYIQIQPGDVWVYDVDSAYYNTLQSSNMPGKDWKDSEAENLYSKFTRNLSVAAIYFDYNGDGRTSGSARTNGGSDLFIDGIGSAGQMGNGYGDIKISSADMLALLPLLDINRSPRLIVS